MDKKDYVTPELTAEGDVEGLTKGDGWSGNDDQFWFIHWGTDPTTG